MTSSTLQPALDRIALAIGEQRTELGVSQRELAIVAGVGRDTIMKVERGGRIRPDLLLRIAETLTVLELYAAPKAVEEPVLAKPKPRSLPTPVKDLLAVVGGGEAA